MVNYKKVVKADIASISGLKKSFRDIYDVMFSHKDDIAYETLKDNEINEITYSELKNKINAFTFYLKEKIQKATEEYIGIDLPNGPDFLIAFWAVLQSGNKPYLVNSFYPVQLRNKLLLRLNAKFVITEICDYSDFITIKPSDCDFLAQNVSCYDFIWANEMALSSSLTGLEAKICVYDGQSICNQILNAVGILKKNNWLMSDYNNRIKIIAILPFFHIYGIIVSYFWLAFFGRTIVFLNNFSPETIKNTIQRHRVTHVFAPPILFHKLYKNIQSGILRESEKRKKQFKKFSKFTFALQNLFPRLGIRFSKRIFKDIIDASFGNSVKFMISGGAFIDKDALKVINNIGYPLFNGYGTTETSITSVNLGKKIKHRITGSVGVPFDSVKYTILDDQTLSICGSSVCKKIISFNSEETGFNCISTNDIVKKQKGEYYIVGRKSDLYIGENGENISPDIIQNEIKTTSANNFCVLELNGKLSLILEYNALLPDLTIKKEIEKIISSLQSAPYGFAVSEIFFTRDKISGDNAVKVSRALLSKMIKEGEVHLQKISDMSVFNQNAPESPENSDAGIALIKGVFKKALDSDADIDINAHFFFDLGGTSLDYFVMIEELSTIFNIRINLENKNNLYTVLDIYKYLTNLDSL